ncbi:hypothetical protein CG747_20780 [Streptomyces sp. CB02959]|uniref:hypothetical protein n=1 Tax=Streptomyces sp. CB02959 TaxID=2020330 RepID=UPI000C277A5F|nr:hypothetical protein [Streptomyces sp. CB02959]PJN38978.1 hypothetical protein CG747_20780 [Streptomyces sp. CB02959]
MAARKTEDRPQATVRTQEYAAGSGWEVGQTAPDDAFRALDDQAAPYGPVVRTHPGGHARLIVAKGATVTESAARELAAAETVED